MREGSESPTPLRGPRQVRGRHGLNLAAQVAAEREEARPAGRLSDPLTESGTESDSEELVLPEDLREMRARAAEARRARAGIPAGVPEHVDADEPESHARSRSVPASRPARALPRVPDTAPYAGAPAPPLPDVASVPALLAARAGLALPRRSSLDDSRSASAQEAVPVPAPALSPSPELGAPGGWGLGAIMPGPAARGGTPETGATEVHASDDTDEAEAREAREAQATREAQAALHARLARESEERQAARDAQASDDAPADAEAPRVSAELSRSEHPAAAEEPSAREQSAAAADVAVPAMPAAEPEAMPAPPEPAESAERATEAERASAPEAPGAQRAEAAPRTLAPPLTTSWLDPAPRDETRSLPGAFPAPPLVPLAVPETSAARTTHNRRESRRGRRRGDVTNSLLAALSTPPTGPGNPLPSLYGYFSNEPAPTSLSPAGVSYGANGNGRIGMHNWRAPVPHDAAHPAGSETIGRIHPGLAERILASGPSISNLHPVTTNLLMSPGADARANAAQLRKSRVQPGSVAFAAGALSDIGSTKTRARDAQLSHKFEENAMLAFSWTIEQVSSFVEQVRRGERRHEAWHMHPLFGGERWRLELDRSESGGEGVLVLHLTCLAMMGLAFNAELPTQVMIGIRTPQRLHRAPSMLASDYVWREFLPFQFHQQKDTLSFSSFPELGALLADTPIGEQDALELVVQIAAGPSVLPEHNEERSGDMRLPFETPNAVQVPRSLLHSLANLVDDAGTGDLMIIVREKGLQQQPSEELAESVGLKTFVQPWPTGAPMPMLPENVEPEVCVRDRVLWAHASVLRARSEFFDTMLDSSFSESAQHDGPGSGRGQGWRRPYRVLRIPDADYVTLYWFLRYLYTEEVQLLHDEDIQAVTLDDHWILGQEGTSSQPDWKWRPVEALDDGESLISSSPGGDTSLSRLAQARSPLVTSAATNPMLSDLQSGRNVEVTTNANDGMPQCKPGKMERRQRSSSTHSPCASDPHPHPPMLPVPPASALALYRLAHRYHILPLCDLTTAHIIAQLTPQNATNYLLCTALFEQLQYSIQHYICTCDTLTQSNIGTQCRPAKSSNVAATRCPRASGAQRRAVRLRR